MFCGVVPPHLDVKLVKRYFLPKSQDVAISNIKTT